jgi:hypothetical protein
MKYKTMEELRQIYQNKVDYIVDHQEYIGKHFIVAWTDELNSYTVLGMIDRTFQYWITGITPNKLSRKTWIR